MKASTPALLASIFATTIAASTSVHAADDVYTDFPITVKGYSGEARTSVSYGGQVARQLLHDSLKKLAGEGNGQANPALRAKMQAYFAGKEPGREILAPLSKGKFVIEQGTIDTFSKKKELAEKSYKGAVSGWPGNMTGVETISFMLDKAAQSDRGFDPLTGYDYKQLMSKFLMGAVFYNQAVDNYLTRNLARDTKPNSEPYSKGAPYTGKEHVWDEAFGYFGAPAHALRLSAKQAYSIAKADASVFSAADFNGNGRIDLETEMTYGPAYYAADADKSGKTTYLHTITKAFIDGRALLAEAKGEALSDSQYAQLTAFAATIKSNWEKVLAEATFKYAGSVYRDLKGLQEVVAKNGDAGNAFLTYGKHWGELKGFAMALQAGGKDLGETAVKLNRLLGYGPVLLGGNQVSGVDGKGNYQFSGSGTLGDYMVHMLKVQQLMVDAFGVTARKNDSLAGMSNLMKKLGDKKAAETD
ncbi:MAG: hypothetical protein ACI9DC_002635 [Gammaproteobacteria bacterium]|jgi:hypothetical protein